MHVVGVLVFTFAHAVLTVTLPRADHRRRSAAATRRWWTSFQELFFLNFDWEMMTYWAVVGLSHALDFHRESQERALTAAQLEHAAGRGAAAGAAAPAASALPVQHAAHDLGADASRHRGRRRDAGAAQRPAAADARPHRHAAGAAQGGARLPPEVSRDRADALRRSSAGAASTIEPDTLDASVPNLLLQPLVENAHPPRHRAEGRRRPRCDIRARREGGRAVADGPRQRRRALGRHAERASTPASA